MSDEHTDGDEQEFPSKEELEQLIEDRPDPETFHKTALLVLAGSRVLEVLQEQESGE